MANKIISPSFSFVQLSTTPDDAIKSCNFLPINLCLPVYDDTDVAFQWFVHGDVPTDIDPAAVVQIGLVKECDDNFLLQFGQTPDAFRISDLDMLYNWPHGLPNFKSVINVRDCFRIKVIVGSIAACSNCFQRIGDICQSAIIEYACEENAFGFNYCADPLPESLSRAAKFIPFDDVSEFTLYYGKPLSDVYGIMPNVEIWVQNGFGIYEKLNPPFEVNKFPPTEFHYNFGASKTGFLKLV